MLQSLQKNLKNFLKQKAPRFLESGAEGFAKAAASMAIP